MRKINKDLIEKFGWDQCTFCKNVAPVEKGLGNRKMRPRINKETGLCTDCEKINMTVKNSRDSFHSASFGANGDPIS